MTEHTTGHWELDTEEPITPTNTGPWGGITAAATLLTLFALVGLALA